MMEFLDKWQLIVSQINPEMQIDAQKFLEALPTSREEQEQTLSSAENVLKLLLNELNEVGEVVDAQQKNILRTEVVQMIVEEELSQIIPSTNDKPTPKFTPETTQFLKTFFSSQPYPTTEQKQQLCLQTGLSETQLNTWFQNARNRNKNK